MLSPSQVPVGVGPPVMLTIPVTSEQAGGLDLTTVDSVTFTMLKPDGTRLTLSGSTFGTTTATLLTAQYGFTGSECSVVGAYLVRVNLIVSGGSIPCGPAGKLLVTAI
jgi:hypothetical protein